MSFLLVPQTNRVQLWVCPSAVGSSRNIARCPSSITTCTDWHNQSLCQFNSNSEYDYFWKINSIRLLCWNLKMFKAKVKASLSCYCKAHLINLRIWINVQHIWSIHEMCSIWPNALCVWPIIVMLQLSKCAMLLTIDTSNGTCCVVQYIQGGAVKTGPLAILSHCKYSENSMTELVDICNRPIICWTQSLTFYFKISSRCGAT